MANKKAPKNAEIFGCENCDYKCCKKSDMDRHNLTTKHQKATKSYKNATKMLHKKTPFYILTK